MRLIATSAQLAQVMRSWENWALSKVTLKRGVVNCLNRSELAQTEMFLHLQNPLVADANRNYQADKALDFC